MRWFRFYDEALDDPKVQRLPPPLFKAWVNILCLANRHNGHLPSLDDIAFNLRISESEAGDIVDDLVSVGLLDATAEPVALRPHNWEGRQYKGDTPAERMKRYRHRKRYVTGDVTDVVTGDVTVDVLEQSRTDTDTDKKEPPLVPPSGGRQARGSRLPSDWMPNPEECDFAAKLHLDAHATANKFRDYWTARPGAPGRKLDWSATWRNWCRKEAENPFPRAGPTPAVDAPQMTGPERAEWARKVLATPGRNPGLERTAKQFLETHEASNP